MVHSHTTTPTHVYRLFYSDVLRVGTEYVRLVGLVWFGSGWCYDVFAFVRYKDMLSSVVFICLTKQVSALRRQRFGHSRQLAAAAAKKDMPTSQVPPGIASAMAAAVTATVPIVRRNVISRGPRLKRRMSSVFSSEGARQKWRNMGKMVSECVDISRTS